MLIAGWRPLPNPNTSSAYGGVGRVIASAADGGAAGVAFGTFLGIDCANASYSSHVTSVRSIQNGWIVTVCCGPSSDDRPGSVGGLPIVNVPPGIATMSNRTFVPEMVSV